MSRVGIVARQTTETKIAVTVNLDGSGRAEVQTGIGFFDHMLILWTKHGQFDLTATVDGDLHIDSHLTVDDTGIV